VLTGDFNVAAEEWGSVRSNARGQALLEMANRRGLTLANDGRKPTFRRAEQESFLNLTPGKQRTRWKTGVCSIVKL
jgi:hypothetical protein